MRLNALLVALLAACSGASNRPVAIATGETACDYCHMTLDHERHAAQLIPARGAPRIFDEPGCLLRYVVTSGDTARDAALWVKDAAGGEWLDARAAWYSIPERPADGMMYGVIAWSGRDAAEQAARAAGGRVADYPTLLAELGT